MIPLCWQHGISLGFVAGICPEPRSKWDLPRNHPGARAHIFVGSLAAMYDGYDKNIQAPKYGWLPCQWKIVENPQFTDAFATKTSIYKGFSIVF